MIMAAAESSPLPSNQGQSAQDSWEAPIVLSLDGGGIRGLSPLLIIKYLFMEVANIDKNSVVEPDTNEDGDTIARPCHYLDHIVGTSTGGLIAILLSRFRMSVQDAIDTYLRFANQIFGKARRLNVTRYSSRSLERVLKRICRADCVHGDDCNCEQKGFRQSDYKQDAQRRCTTTVVTRKRNYPPEQKGIQKDATHPDEVCALRSYDHLPNDNPNLGPQVNKGYADKDLLAWQAARATTAAPTYFPVFKIKNDPHMDGGLKANNPAGIAWDSARQVSTASDQRLAILISIGTGFSEEPPHFQGRPIIGNIPSLLKSGRYQLSETESTHRSLKRVVENQGTPKTYYKRFNVDRDLGEMKLNEWIVDDWKHLLGKTSRASRRHRRDQPHTNEGYSVPGLVDRNAEPVLDNIAKYRTVNEIEYLTQRYLSRRSHSDSLEEIRPQILECAEQLVHRARLRRATDMERWHNFTDDR